MQTARASVGANEAGLCRVKRGAPSGPGHPNQDTGVFTVAEVRRLLAVAGEVRNSANRGRATQDFSGRTDNFLGCPMERMALGIPRLDRGSQVATSTRPYPPTKTRQHRYPASRERADGRVA
ncbi:MAG: hypothetical protein ACR2HA_02080, partial [Nocardioides sp.]